MSKIAVVYWSGTGNTEAMAHKVVEGAEAAGAEVSLFTAADFNAGMMDQFDAVGFGCPSMGAEVLEEDEFEPMFKSCEPNSVAKGLLFLVPMAGVTATGCAIGMKPAAKMALSWPAILSSAMKPLTMRLKRLALP